MTLKKYKGTLYGIAGLVYQLYSSHDDLRVMVHIFPLYSHFLLSSNFSLFLFKGEIFELKAELNSDKKEKKKEAVKKVIASMTVGKDVRWA